MKTLRDLLSHGRDPVTVTNDGHTLWTVRGGWSLRLMGVEGFIQFVEDLAEQALLEADAVAVELVLDGLQGLGVGGHGALEGGVGVLDVDVEAHRSAADRPGAGYPLSGDSSDTLISESPICSFAMPTLPPGAGMRIRSVAPSTLVSKSIAA